MHKSLLFNKLQKLTNLAGSLTKSHPVLVVIALHEYFRNLYNEDPFIKKRKHQDVLKNILLVMDDCINFLKSGKKFGSYFEKLNNKSSNKLNVSTGDLFGTLWKDRDLGNELNAKNTLRRFYTRSKVSNKIFKNKEVLDMGCGSGRFTAAFSKLGAKKVIGVDKGEIGLSLARHYAKKNNIKNVKYINASVLNLPFKDEKFDYVFCKGVLHHTGNLKKGLEEFNRMIKKGGSGFLYLYGSGGLFWKSRIEMRKVMKKISYKDAFNILKIIGLPPKRTIFLDSWYVEIEEHVKQKFLEKWFKKKKLSFSKYKNALPYELERMEKYKNFKLMYGTGELRYFVSK